MIPLQLFEEESSLCINLSTPPASIFPRHSVSIQHGDNSRSLTSNQAVRTQLGKYSTLLESSPPDIQAVEKSTHNTIWIKKRTRWRRLLTTGEWDKILDNHDPLIICQHSAIISVRCEVWCQQWRCPLHLWPHSPVPGGGGCRSGQHPDLRTGEVTA